MRTHSQSGNGQSGILSPISGSTSASFAWLFVQTLVHHVQSAKCSSDKFSIPGSLAGLCSLAWTLTSYAWPEDDETFPLCWVVDVASDKPWVQRVAGDPIRFPSSGYLLSEQDVHQLRSGIVWKVNISWVFMFENKLGWAGPHARFPFH